MLVRYSIHLPLLFSLLYFFPVSYSRIPVGRLISSIVLPSLLLLLLASYILQNPSRVLKISFFASIPLFFLFYQFCSTFFFSIATLDDIPRDLFLLLQILGCVSTVLLVRKGKTEINAFLDSPALQNLFLAILGFALITFLFKPLSFLDIYSVRLDRFSSLASSTNYIWIYLLPPLIVSLSRILSHSSTVIKDYAILSLVLVSLFYSVSRTSLIICLMITTMLVLTSSFRSIWLFTHSLRVPKPSRMSFFILGTLLTVLFILYHSVLFSSDLFSDTLNRFWSLFDGIQRGVGFLEIQSYNKRHLNWSEILYRFPPSFLGYGPLPQLELAFDNQYLLALVRTGYIGLFMLITLLISLLILNVRNLLYQQSTINWLLFSYSAVLPFAFWTSTPLNELKSQYLLYLIISMSFSLSSFKRKATVNLP